MNKLQHGMNCDAMAHPIDGDCTCGLVYRERIATLEKEVDRLTGELAEMRFRPSDDNHRNANVCPYCQERWNEVTTHKEN